MASPNESAGPARGPALGQPAPKWVWRSSLASRAAGLVSLWACVETLGAVAFYWLIAYAYDTHWHLISSVLIAPMLLLRSPESMTAGVRWFRKDWFGMELYDDWPKGKKVLWIVAVALISGWVTRSFALWLSQRWLPGMGGWPLFGLSAAIAVLSVAGAVAVAGAVTVVGSGASADAVAGAAGGAFAVAVSSTGAFAGAFAGAGAVTGAFSSALLSPGFGAGLALRSIFFRLLATLRHLPAGAKRLPENWWENNFLTDSFLPAELMPGIRDFDPMLSMDGLLKRIATRRDLDSKALLAVLGVFCFLPAFLYRLNIKATAWFWWPLAYLLRPAPNLTTTGEETQALCWPWTNLFQRGLIIVSVVLAIGSLVVHGFDRTNWGVLKDLPALQFVIKVAFAMDWVHVAPWHIVQWLIAGSGVGLLWVAADALSHHRNGNWEVYRQQVPGKIRLMELFQRVRYLGGIALLVMAVGAVLLLDPGWRQYVPVPDEWVVALEKFYVVQK